MGGGGERDIGKTPNLRQLMTLVAPEPVRLNNTIVTRTEWRQSYEKRLT